MRPPPPPPPYLPLSLLYEFVPRPPPAPPFASMLPVPSKLDATTRIAPPEPPPPPDAATLLL